MLLRSTGTSSSIVHQLTHRVPQSVVVVVPLRPFSSTPLGSAFAPSRTLRRYRFETAYAFKAKPGSPNFSSRDSNHLTSSSSQGSVTDHELKSDDDKHPSSTSTSEQDQDQAQGSFTRPDWINLSAKPRLQQGLQADHPAMVWRDEVWSQFPWGAGHDWFFVQEVQAETGTLTESSPRKDLVIGVADGVGGWVDSGIDPSLFAQTLMWFCRQEVVQNGHKDPLKVIQNAYAAVLGEKGILAGSSTACVLSFDAEAGNVQAANLGDSTFLLLRRKPSSSPAPSPTVDFSSSSPPTPDDPNVRAPLTHSVVHMQPSQTHFFNAPRQLAKIPKGSDKQGALMDMPEGADLFEAGLNDGDILVLATDGFSDNVWPQELEQLVALLQEHEHEFSSPASSEDSTTGTPPSSPKKEPKTFAQALANVCVRFAKICATKENKPSPFEIEARRYGQRGVRGGKVDDVCVVVVVVNKE